MSTDRCDEKSEESGIDSEHLQHCDGWGVEDLSSKNFRRIFILSPGRPDRPISLAYQKIPGALQLERAVQIKYPNPAIFGVDKLTSDASRTTLQLSLGLAQGGRTRRPLSLSRYFSAMC